MQSRDPDVKPGLGMPTPDPERPVGHFLGTVAKGYILQKGGNSWLLLSRRDLPLNLGWELQNLPRSRTMGGPWVHMHDLLQAALPDLRDRSELCHWAPSPSSGLSLTPWSWGVSAWLHQRVRLSWGEGQGVGALPWG